jgi:hypothetical protein
MAVTTEHSTEKAFGGPWLLDRSALNELDGLFDRWFTASLEENEHQNEATKRALSSREEGYVSYDPPPKKEAVLHFGDQKRLIASSITELESDPTVPTSPGSRGSSGQAHG